MNTNSVKARIEKLRADSEVYIQLGDKMHHAFDSTFYQFDIFVNAILHRSLNLTLGFCDLIEKRNIICAGSLLRLQIDNCLRLYAGFMVRDPHKFAIEVLDGKPINRMKDKHGNIMRDSYLVEQLSQDAEWIKRVYKETSGYIHFSEKHIFNTIRAVSDSDRTLEFVIAKEDPFIPESIYLELIDAYVASSELLIKYIKGWIFTKDNPELVQEYRRTYIEKYGKEPDCRTPISIAEK